jgi:hypothetical protein
MEHGSVTVIVKEGITMQKYSPKQTYIISQFLYHLSPELWDNYTYNFIQEDKNSRRKKNLPIPEEDYYDDLLHYHLCNHSAFHILSLETGELIKIINFEEDINLNLSWEEINDYMRGIQPLSLYPIEAYSLDPIPDTRYIKEQANEAIMKAEEMLEDEYSLNTVPFGSTERNPVRIMKQDGVTQHKPAWEGPWHESRVYLILRAKDEAGNVTDEFYGGQNDFDEWFLANANMGRKMRIEARGKHEDEWHKITEIKHIFFGGVDRGFELENGSWKMTSSRTY